MAVGAANECSEPRAWTTDPDSDRIVRGWKVPVSDPADNPLLAAGLPDEDDEHPTRTDLICLRLDAHLIDARDWRFYLVTAEYVTVEAAEAQRVGGINTANAIANSGSTPTDPTTQPVQGGGGSSVTASKVLYKDLGTPAKPALNSAKFPFSEAITTTVTMARFTRMKNLAAEPTDLSVAHVGKVNNTVFAGRDKDTVLMDSMTWNRVGRRNKNNTYTIWYPTTAHFLYNPLKFVPLEVLDCGFCDINGNVFRDKWDTPLPNPSLLDGAGKKAAAGAEPKYIEFTTYKRSDFNELGWE